jgi:methyl-accepting chemotaxis protein
MSFFKEKFKLTGKIFIYTTIVVVIVLSLYITSSKWSAVFDVFGWENPSSFWFNFFIFCVVILVGAILTLIFAGRITVDLRKLSRTAELIGNGDLTSKIPPPKNRMFPDESDELYDSVSQMLLNLKSLVTLLKETSGKIHSSSDFLIKSVDSMNSYGSELNISMSEILNGVKMQKEIAGVAIENVRNMVKNIHDSGEAARKMASSMVNANKTATTGEELAKESINRMKILFDQTEATGKAVSSFVERFKQVNKMVEFITGVAQKTNLLALNASIEAARAGDMGKGFAIVAEEIRKLADSTSRSANQISELVKTFEKDSVELMGLLKESVSGIEESRSDVGIIMNSLDNIVKNVQEVHTKFDEISKLSSSQKTLAEGLVNSSESVLEIADKNAQQVVGMSLVVSKEVGAMDKMGTNAKNMAELSGNLEGIVSKFKIKDNQ